MITSAYNDPEHHSVIFRIEIPEELLIDATMETLRDFNILDTNLMRYVAQAILESSRQLAMSK